MNYAILWTARWTRKLLDFLFRIRLRAASQGCRNLLRTSARKGATGTEPRIRTVRQLAAAAGDGPLGFAGSPGPLETSLNSGYSVGPCNSYLEGPTLVFGRLLAHRAVSDCSLPLAAMFAGLPPSSSELTERKSVVPASPPADRRREHRESAVTDARSCLAARLQKHFGNGAVRRVDVALIEPDQIPDRILEDASQGPASGACAVQFEDTCHEIETAQ
jgi:hypothetical protein